MERFVLVLDDDCNGDWIRNMQMDNIPYPFKIYIANGIDSWMDLNEIETRIKSVCNQKNIEYDLTKKIHSLSINNHNNHNNNDYIYFENRHASFTTFASIIHSACFHLKSFLKNNENIKYSLELIWKFPIFDQNENNFNFSELNAEMIDLWGAFQRFIQCNNGYIHILTQQQSIKQQPQSTDDNINLMSVNEWQEILGGSQYCTIWNLQNEINDEIFANIIKQIIKPFRLTNVQFKCNIDGGDNNNDPDNHNESVNGKMEVDDDKEESADIIIKDIKFNFDLTPCFLYNRDDEQYVNKLEWIWKDWSDCYHWSSMKILKCINKSSFPNYLLLSDMKTIQNSNTEPVIFVLNANNKNAEILHNCWRDLYQNTNKDIAWIIAFGYDMNDNINPNHLHHVNELSQNAFINEDEWEEYYKNDNIITDDDNDQSITTSKSSNYLLHPMIDWNNNDKFILIAHRIIDDNQITMKLLYKQSSNIKINSNDTDDKMQKLYNNLINLSQNNDFVVSESNKPIVKKEEIERQFEYILGDNDNNNNLWKNYNQSLLNECDEYMDELCESNDGVIINNNTDNNNHNETPNSMAPTPANSLFSTSSSSISILNIGNKHETTKRRRRNKKKKSNRGLAAIEAAAKQCGAQTPTKRSFQNNPVSATKIIQSAVNYQKNRKKIKTENKNNIHKNRYKDLETTIEDHITIENILNVFDENGELRDKSKEIYFEKIDSENSLMRKDWRKYREMIQRNPMGHMNNNWPIKPRFYGNEAVEYEEKIHNVKEQYLNVTKTEIDKKNNKDRLFEMIGDLMDNDDNIITNHAITFIEKIVKNDINYRQKNKQIMNTEIGRLLEEQVDKNKNIDKFREIRRNIFEKIWRFIGRDKTIDCDKQTEQHIIKRFTGRKFEGLWCFYSEEWENSI